MNCDHVKTLDIISSQNESISPIINAATAQIKDIQKNFKLDKELNDKIKSTDELDALMRHLLEGDWAAVAWRAMANLQRECDDKKSSV